MSSLPSAENFLVAMDHTITLKEELDAVRTFRNAVLEAVAMHFENELRGVFGPYSVADRIRKLKEEP